MTEKPPRKGKSTNAHEAREYPLRSTLLTCRVVGSYLRLTIMGRARAPVVRRGVSEPSVVLKEYIQRRSKR